MLLFLAAGFGGCYNLVTAQEHYENPFRGKSIVGVPMARLHRWRTIGFDGVRNFPQGLVTGLRREKSCTFLKNAPAGCHGLSL
jgi:hypothetical protein